MTDRVSNVRAVFSANTTQLDQALTSVQGKLRQFGTAANSLASAVGVGFGAAAIVQFTTQAINAGNALERVQASLRAVTGSQAEYNRVLAVAQTNQQLFGGSLEQNLMSMQQFAFLANRTGASLEELNRVAQLLAVVNPMEGFEGAGFALSELFAGDITSIVERFNLPRSAVRALADEGVSAQERLQGLTDLLAQQGITSEALAASLDTTAQSYRELGTATSNAIASIGQAAAETFQPTIDLITTLINKFIELQNLAPEEEMVTGFDRVNDVIEFINAMLTTEEASKAANEAVMAQSRTFDDYVNGINAIIEKTDQWATQSAIANGMLRESQFVYAQALMMTGVSLEDAIVQAREYGMVTVENAMGDEYAQESATALSDAQSMLAEAVRNSTALQRTHFDMSSYGASVLDTQTIATKAVEEAMNAAAKAIYEVSAAGGSMNDQAEAAANVLISMGSAGEEMARKLAMSINPLDQLIARLYDINLNIAQARQDFAGLPAAGVPVRPIVTSPFPTGGTRGGGGGTSPRVSAAEQESERLTRIAQDYQDSSIRAEERYQERLLRITEDYAERRRQAALNFSDQQFEDRVDFYRALSNIEDQAIRQQAAAEYEALAQEAATIRDAQGADVAATFLAQAAQISAARARRASEIAKARKDGSDNLEYLVALDKMEREVEDRRLTRARTGEGSLASDEQRDREDAQLKRQQDLEQASKDAGKALLDAQASATTAVTTTNDALTKQLELLQRIGAPVGPTGTTTSTATTQLAPVAAAAALGGGQNANGLAVYDVAVVSALSQVRDAVAAVERAVGRVANARPLVSTGG